MIDVEMKNNQMNRIKEVLNEKGIKQTWLAEKLGKSLMKSGAMVFLLKSKS